MRVVSHGIVYFPSEWLDMKGLILTAVLLGCFAFMSGCPKTIIRDANVYKVEMQWFTQAALQQADYLETFVREHCVCEESGDAFVEPDCQKAARLLLTAKVRTPWHHGMALYNAGLLEVRPSEDPPVIPDVSTLCPQGEE